MQILANLQYAKYATFQIYSYCFQKVALGKTPGGIIIDKEYIENVTII